MSSHHIVREKQEPALLIMSLNRFDTEHLGQLLEWNPFILVNGGVYEQADRLGIKIDAVVSSNPNLVLQENTRLIGTTDNPLEDALKYLVGDQYPAVNIIDDRFVLKEYALFAEEINLVIFCSNKKIVAVPSRFSKWKPAGEQIELMHEVNDLTTSGLFYLTDHVLETEKDGFYSLTFQQPFIFIAEII